jgi:exodeoxyribonuclease VII large subunit
MSERIWSVAALIAEVNTLLEQGFSGVHVEGEVTNVSTSGRGHLYFTLKDDSAALDCVMWAARARRIKFQVEDGLAALALGSLTIYRQRGRFQLVVEDLQPQGVGALQLAFEQLKKKLEIEGLFATERKRQIPALPNRVGIVTSATGAALADMLKVLRRFPHVETLVAPARVQGEGAAEEIADALRRLGSSGRVNVIIVGRGGGSLEDLWAFNEEAVARAIADSPIPVISGVGHETDFTIADFVADIRATTPTQAAELLVTRLEEQQRRIHDAQVQLARELRRQLELARSLLTGLEGSSGLARLPQRVRLARERLRRSTRLGPALHHIAGRSHTRLDRATAILRRFPAGLAAGGHRRLMVSRRQQAAQLMKARIGSLRARTTAGEKALIHLGPSKVLERGYSITTLEGSSKPLKDAATVRSGQALMTRLARGELRSLVGKTGRKRSPPPADADRQPSLFEDDDPSGKLPEE